MEINREALAWAAGFIDGEGSFTLHKTHGRPTDKRSYGTPKLEVAQVNRQVLDKLQNILQFGKVRGPYSQNKRNQNDYYRFQACNFEEVQFIVAAVWQWLGPVKREQAKQVITAYHELNNRPKLKAGPVPRIPTCHPDRKHGALGLCESCYSIQWRNRGNK